jgi:uncharacterized protein
MKAVGGPASLAQLPGSGAAVIGARDFATRIFDLALLRALVGVGRAERVLREAGFPVVRVRHHGDVARIEVPPEDRPRLVATAEGIVARLKELGYVWVACDLEGYRSGSMNEAL